MLSTNSSLRAAMPGPIAMNNPQSRRVATLQVVRSEAVYADEDDKLLGRQAG
jgi:hypothetical protein